MEVLDMPVLQVNLTDPADVRAGIDMLTRQLNSATQAAQVTPPAAAQQPLAQPMAEMKRKKIWRFLDRVATLNVPEYSLPELGGHIGLSSNKVCSLKAILAKPEQRLGVQFFELAPSGAVDTAGNPRYRMPDAIKQAIQAA
jgi:hypothetical protein